MFKGEGVLSINLAVKYLNIYFVLSIVQPGDIPATLTLARYLRDYLELTGTKVSCNQSGCGACTVTAEIPDPSDPNSLRTKSVNSVSIRTILCFFSLSFIPIQFQRIWP